ncbi:39S ribosomal protein L37, mitochondrial isoform X2 [Diachasma alloeum]|nr:39S ribosomal protein L37, mitochondrial isoform X2 [Diachasma alloeum]XP_015121868.1 39S ribosomal protein L37, mitochondrial isoform X2 [Diachasma alloeum]XP_015121869.1 39S ribosomal protein L37, mitochondrial isoform X2 [Diachasma alloeum]XP_015121870.1 39S ribosomal protein L37, mitochondrial isoform X2 [Diachasma alloeum]XP_015121871.1 39S ribosomal protein L37, mitochondrial isoform X2 [Diachasma alloeum]
MKITQALCRQHLGRMIKFNWFMATKKRPLETHTEFHLAKMGIPIVDPLDIVNPIKERIDVSQYFEHMPNQPPIPKDENHPDYKLRPCLKVMGHDLLVQGTQQAQVLTKSLLIKDSLPEKVESLLENTSEEVDETVQRIIRSSNIYDAHQEKIPKRKNPEKPAWNYPRDYGLTDIRKSRNLTIKMLQLCETLCGFNVAQQRQIIHNGLVQVPLVKDGDLVEFSMKMDLLMTSMIPLTPMGSTADAADKTLPELYPLLSTAGLRRYHFYDLKLLYPIAQGSPWSTPHTIFIYHDCQRVKNLTEIPVEQDQLFARSLIEAFATTATYARQKYGDSVEDLPEPLAVQCVHVDGQNFHFSVFQLNTLNIEEKEGKMNYWWCSPQISLFEQAKYENARPVLEGYNPDVFKRLLAFYKNV